MCTGDTILDLARIAIRMKDQTRFISADCVLLVRAQGNYVSLHCESASYLLRESITAMQKQMEPCGLVRIHRSVLVDRTWGGRNVSQFDWRLRASHEGWEGIQGHLDLQEEPQIAGRT